MIQIENTKITIDLDGIMRKDGNVSAIAQLEDIVVRNYHGQDFLFFSTDGNDVNNGMLLQMIDRLQQALNIPDHKISFKTVVQPPSQYHWEPQDFVYDFVEFGQYNRDLTDAKFVGMLAGSRPSMHRLRLLYELGNHFPEDSFLTCNTEPYLDLIQYMNNQWQLFQREVDWLKTAEFHNDQPTPAGLDFKRAATDWVQIWNKYKIEIVVETNEYANQFLSDKTTKVLATGKPFLLLCGSGSLQKLRDIGFHTFGDCIDESYDECLLPTQRIQKMLASLQNLYQHPDRDNIVQQMCQHAEKNIYIYSQQFAGKFVHCPAG